MFPKLVSGRKNLKDVKPTSKRYVVKMPLYKKVPLSEREHLLRKTDRWELIDTIEWEDYRGEDIQAGRAEWLVSSIRESDGIIMIVDACELDSQLGENGGNHNGNEYAAMHIEMLADLVNEVGGICPPIAIVLTKYDLVDEQTVENTPNKIMREVTMLLAYGLIDRDNDYNCEVFLSTNKKNKMKKYPPASALYWLIENIITE